jgi:hypothetical protein
VIIHVDEIAGSFFEVILSTYIRTSATDFLKLKAYIDASFNVNFIALILSNHKSALLKLKIIHYNNDSVSYSYNSVHH